MIKRRKAEPTVDGLSLGEMEILLFGESASDPFLIFDVDRLEDGYYLRRRWQEFRAPLLAEWRRRGCEGEPWGAREFDHHNDEMDQ